MTSRKRREIRNHREQQRKHQVSAMVEAGVGPQLARKRLDVMCRGHTEGFEDRCLRARAARVRAYRGHVGRSNGKQFVELEEISHAFEIAAIGRRSATRHAEHASRRVVANV